ncbi:MAG: hypothetical protein JW825_02135 [Candidatus Methanofastidiosa archaeon]|nr:hypothetical protein [Candidatus Methanofastidiosa archaeon]
MKKEDLLKRLAEKGYCEEKIEGLISEKRKALGPHVTEEGLYALIAAEHGIREAVEEPKLTIEGLQPGLSNLSLLVKVIKLYDEKEFQRGDRKGKRQSILLGDQTGKVFLTLWDREVDQYYNKVHNGNILRLLDIVSSQGPSGVQLGLGPKGRLVVEDEKKYKDLMISSKRQITRKHLDEISPGDRSIEIRATISNLYRLTTYDSCPECNRGLIKTTNNYYYCEHCKTRTTPNKSMVIEIGLDDGYGHSRAIFFGDSAAELISEAPDSVARDVQSFLDAGFNPKNVGLEYLMENKPDLLGREILISGSVNETEFKGLVINVFDVKPIDFEYETTMIFQELEDEFND